MRWRGRRWIPEGRQAQVWQLRMLVEQLLELWVGGRHRDSSELCEEVAQLLEHGLLGKWALAVAQHLAHLAHMGFLESGQLPSRSRELAVRLQ